MKILNLINSVLSDYTLQIVAMGSAILGIISGVIGSFAVIRKESLLGDAVSHAALPGIAITFLITQTKNTEVLLLGALISGLIATLIIILIDRHSRVKYDSALALILSVFFGFGMVLLTYIQKLPNANQAGLESFIYGQASTLLKRDVQVMMLLGVVLIGLVVLFWKEFKLVSFDSDYAESLGFSSRKITLILSTMIVASIIIGLQTVGVILMSAMLTAPAVAARQWTDKLWLMVVLAAVFGSLSGIIGTISSSIIPNLPTGPMIVLTISFIVIVSLTLAPNRGLVWKYFKDRRNQKDINEDRLLNNLYQLYKNHDNEWHPHDIYTIKPEKIRSKQALNYAKDRLESLERKGLVQKEYFDCWAITEKGIDYMENFISKGGL